MLISAPVLVILGVKIEVIKVGLVPKTNAPVPVSSSIIFRSSEEASIISLCSSVASATMVSSSEKVSMDELAKSVASATIVSNSEKVSISVERITDESR